MKKNSGLLPKIICLSLGLSCMSSAVFAGSSASIAASPIPLTWQQAGLMQGFPPAESKLVTKANFSLAPYNRWGLQHMRYLNATAPIERGTVAVSKLAAAPVNLIGQSYQINNQAQNLQTFAKQSYTDGLIVLHNGKIVTEWYDDGMTAATPHWLASMTKSFIGTLGELMIYQGKLDPTKKVEFYIPELKGSPFGSATVRQVLDMDVGVVSDGYYEGLHESGSYLNKFAKASGFLPSAEIVSSYDILPQAKSVGANGGKFRYSSPTAEVAGWLIARVANKPLEVVLSNEIWSKLGTAGEAYTVIDPKSKMVSTGGLNFTVRDVARFGQMIANNGKYNGVQVLPPQVVKSIIGGGDKAAWANGDYASMRPLLNSYHSYWYQSDNKNHAVMAMGIYGQHLYVDPVNDVVVVKFASYPTQVVDAYDTGWMEVYPQIVKQLTK